MDQGPAGSGFMVILIAFFWYNPPEEMAKKVGVRRETILSREKGNYYPPVKLAHDIAKVLQPRLMTYSSSKILQIPASPVRYLFFIQKNGHQPQKFFSAGKPNL